MATFKLRSPVSAVQYEFRSNEHEVNDLIKSTGRTGHSFTNTPGHMHVYNSGPELRIEDGSWVVAIGSDIAVLSPDHFTRLFEPA